MRTKTNFASVALVALASFGVLQATPVEAQLANASATALGLSGNNTATVRNFGAISVNPAGLSMPGSGFSLAILPLQIRSGLDPITLSDISDFAGQVIPSATKEDWLQRVVTAGGQTGTFGLDVSEIALTMGNIGLQVSTVVGSDINLPAGTVEAVLFGNAGRTGSPSDLSLAGAAVTGFAISTAGLSFGIPISSASGSMAFGATVKYSVGHGMAVGRSGTGSVQSSPIRVDVDFPLVITSEDEDPINTGNGVGLDLGFMLQQNRLSIGASLQNVVNTFAWDETKLGYRPISAEFSQGSSSSQSSEEAYSGAPANLKALVAAQTFEPSVQLGAALDLSGDFTVSADVHKRFSDEGIALTPNFHMGAGAEFRGLKVIHLRGGAAIITDGIQYSGGASLVLGPLNFSAAAALQTGDLGENILGQFTLSYGGR